VHDLLVRTNLSHEKLFSRNFKMTVSTFSSWLCPMHELPQRRANLPDLFINWSMQVVGLCIKIDLNNLQLEIHLSCLQK
jgi:hypothetical protein